MKKVLDLNMDIQEQNMENTLNNVMSAVLWPLAVLLSWISSLGQDDITFFLGTVVSLCAIAHYAVQIKKNLKDKNKQ
jgi:hypothetical protein